MNDIRRTSAELTIPITSFKNPPLDFAGIEGCLIKGGITLHDYTDDELASGDYESKQIAAELGPRFFSLTARDINRRPMPPVDMKGTAILASDGKSLFSRPLLTELNERERQQAIALSGAMSTPMPTAARCYYISDDDTCGPATQKPMQRDNLAFADEVAGRFGASFTRKVRQPNRNAVEAWKRISPFAYAYDHCAFDARYKGEIKARLDGPLASALRLRHIEPIEDFADIRRRNEMSQRLSIAARRLATANVSAYRRDL